MERIKEMFVARSAIEIEGCFWPGVGKSNLEYLEKRVVTDIKQYFVMFYIQDWDRECKFRPA